MIAATGGAAVTSTPLSGDGYAGVHLTGTRDASIIWRTSGDGSLAYTAPPGLHVVLDAGDRDGHATATAKPRHERLRRDGRPRRLAVARAR